MQSNGGNTNNTVITIIIIIIKGIFVLVKLNYGARSTCGRMSITLVNLWNVINLWLEVFGDFNPSNSAYYIMNIQSRFLESNGSLLKLFTSLFSVIFPRITVLITTVLSAPILYGYLLRQFWQGLVDGLAGAER